MRKLTAETIKNLKDGCVFVAIDKGKDREKRYWIKLEKNNAKRLNYNLESVNNFKEHAWNFEYWNFLCFVAIRKQETFICGEFIMEKITKIDLQNMKNGYFIGKEKVKSQAIWRFVVYRVRNSRATIMFIFDKGTGTNDESRIGFACKMKEDWNYDDFNFFKLKNLKEAKEQITLENL